MTEFLRKFFLFLILRRFYFLPWLVALFFIIFFSLRSITDVYFVFLLFFFFVAFPFEARNVFVVLYFRRFFEGFRCRLRPPAVCILYKPKEQPPPEVPLPGGTVYKRRPVLQRVGILDPCRHAHGAILIHCLEDDERDHNGSDFLRQRSFNAS